VGRGRKSPSQKKKKAIEKQLTIFFALNSSSSHSLPINPTCTPNPTTNKAIAIRPRYRLLRSMEDNEFLDDFAPVLSF
jgi:hypothetical protein